MRIALITPGISPYVMGGIQRHSFNLVRQLARLGVEVDLYHTDFGSAEGIDGLEGIEEELRPRITSIPVPWPKMARLPGHFVRELEEFSKMVLTRMQRNRPVDLVYDQGATGFALAARARKPASAAPAVLLNLHGLEMFQRAPNLKVRCQNLVTRRFYRKHLLACDGVVSLGGNLSETLQQAGVPADLIHVLPNGIGEEWFRQSEGPASDPSWLRFLFVGRHERRKGIEELHQAIRQNPSWRGRAQFRFIGPIPGNKRLKLPHVSYAGAIHAESELREEYRCSDVLLCPSHSEGMPTVILEAMASGMAVIATDVGATQTMVSPANGILLERPAPFLISQAVEQALAWKPVDLAARKAASLSQVQEFRWEHVAAKTVQVFDRLLQPK